jgi:hypothetical protein
MEPHLFDASTIAPDVVPVQRPAGVRAEHEVRLLTLVAGAEVAQQSERQGRQREAPNGRRGLRLHALALIRESGRNRQRRFSKVNVDPTERERLTIRSPSSTPSANSVRSRPGLAAASSFAPPRGPDVIDQVRNRLVNLVYALDRNE